MYPGSPGYRYSGCGCRFHCHIICINASGYIQRTGVMNGRGNSPGIGNQRAYTVIPHLTTRCDIGH